MEINGTIFVQIFIFLMLLLWLSPALFAPILRLFDERDKRIIGARDEAKHMNAQAEDKAKAFDQAYAQAHTEAKLVLSELKKKADLEQAQALEAVRAQARQKLDAAQRELLEQEDKVRRDLHDVSASLAQDIVGSMLGTKAKKGMLV